LLTNEIAEYAPDGSLVATFALQSGENLSGFAVGGNGNVFAGVSGFDSPANIYEYSPDGTTRTLFISGAAYGQSFDDYYSNQLATGPIDGDQVPQGLLPPSYSVTGLSSNVSTLQNYTRGQIVIGGVNGSLLFPDPDLIHGGGSDGVVDVNSQEGGLGSFFFPFIAHDVAHAGGIYAPLFGVPVGQSDTADPSIAAQIEIYLNKPDIPHAFGPFVMPTLQTQAQQQAIDGVVPVPISKNNLGPSSPSEQPSILHIEIARLHLRM
jgi:hypothetical protein